MKIFVFGAGASKGSQSGVGDASLHAPLTDELFNSLYSRFASEVGLTPELLEKYRSGAKGSQSLEIWLTEWWGRTQAIEDTGYKQANLSRFGQISLYLWWLLYNISTYAGSTDRQARYDPSNAYSILISKLFEKGEQFGSISFNYDTLLDKALDKEYGAELYGSLDKYIENRLIKPHGSVNWFFRSNISINSNENRIHNDAISKAMFKQPANLRELLVYSPFEVLTLGHHSSSFIPLMLMPLTTKLYPFFDEFYRKMLQAGMELLSQATEVYFIGYRAQDDIIRNLLESVQRGTTIHVVSNSSSEEIMKYVLKLNNRLVEGQAINGGFAKFCADY